MDIIIHNDEIVYASDEQVDESIHMICMPMWKRTKKKKNG